MKYKNALSRDGMPTVEVELVDLSVTAERATWVCKVNGQLMQGKLGQNVMIAGFKEALLAMSMPLVAHWDSRQQLIKCEFILRLPGSLIPA